MSAGRRCAVLTGIQFTNHDTGSHPENPARIQAILDRLEADNLLEGRPAIPFDAADRAILERVHDPAYLDLLETATARGGAWLDPDTLCGPDSLETARQAAGAAVAAVDAVLDGTVARAFVMARPPGHHAYADRAMGFCLLNSIAVATQRALDRGLERVAIVDWDVHHGNGTQAIFYDRADVLFCSLHQYGGGFFPGTGAANETGSGPGEGYTLNLPLRPGAGDAEYLALLRDHIGPLVGQYDPQLILVSAGFDAHRDDPLGSMTVTASGFAEMASVVVDWADSCCDGKVIALLEGGYDLMGLADSVVVTLNALEGGV